MVDYDKEKRIVESEAFRALDVFGKRAHLCAKGMEQMLLDLMERLVKEGSTYPDDISYHTGMERRACPDIPQDEYTSRIHKKDLESIEFAIREYRASLETLQLLRTTKLRLLGDYDYTRGDDSEAVKVFGTSLDNPEKTD